jgi:hypothetical protein
MMRYDGAPIAEYAPQSHGQERIRRIYRKCFRELSLASRKSRSLGCSEFRVRHSRMFLAGIQAEFGLDLD